MFSGEYVQADVSSGGGGGVVNVSNMFIGFWITWFKNVLGWGQAPTYCSTTESK
jgi:hypothetical protein